MHDVRPEQYATVIRGLIKHENDVTNHRFGIRTEQFARGLGVDLYTTNPVLAEKLTNTAWVAFSGRLGVNGLVSAFVPASTAVTGVSVASISCMTPQKLI